MGLSKRPPHHTPSSAGHPLPFRHREPPLRRGDPGAHPSFGLTRPEQFVATAFTTTKQTPPNPIPSSRAALAAWRPRRPPIVRFQPSRRTCCKRLHNDKAGASTPHYHHDPPLRHGDPDPILSVSRAIPAWRSDTPSMTCPEPLKGHIGPSNSWCEIQADRVKTRAGRIPARREVW